MTSSQGASTDMTELIARLRGRAMFLRNRGGVKSPDLMDQAALALSGIIAPEPANQLPTLDEYRNNLVKQCAQIAEPWSGFAGADKMGTQDREIIKVREEIAAAIMNLSVPSADFCPSHDSRVYFMCQSCEDHNPEGAVGPRSDIAVMPDGTWLCDGCYFDCNKSAYGLIASDVEDFVFPRFEDLPRPAPYGTSALPSTDRPSPDSKLEAVLADCQSEVSEIRKNICEVHAAGSFGLDNRKFDEHANREIARLDGLLDRLIGVRKALAAGG